MMKTVKSSISQDPSNGKFLKDWEKINPQKFNERSLSNVEDLKTPASTMDLFSKTEDHVTLFQRNNPSQLQQKNLQLINLGKSR